MYKIIGADQKEYGPVSTNQMLRWIAEGRVNGQTLVQAEGQGDWRSLATYPELAALVAAPAAPAPVLSPDRARSLVTAPAVAMLIVGIVFALFGLLGVLGAALGWTAEALNQNRGGMPPELARMMENMNVPLAVTIFLVHLAVAGLVIFTSIKMRKLEGYTLAILSSILIMVPGVTPCFFCIPCCIAGLPVGIWSLIVLLKPEVKSAFH
jgi:hypothetical protein